MQQFQHFVETCRVTHSGCADWERTLKTMNRVASQQRFASTHPVSVSLHRVDLAVVRNVAIRVS